MSKVLFTILLTLFINTQSYGWNSLGHRLAAQIAYNNMTKEAKRLSNEYNHALDRFYRPQSFVNAAAWLDSLHSPQDKWLASKHYISLPFSFDGTSLTPPLKVNAVSAVEETKALLLSNADNFTKGFNLRILIHVVADLHQPLHAASQFSFAHPYGDKGGNLVILKPNPIAVNLHRYWDKGGGFLRSRKVTNKQIKRKARAIEEKWPCELTKMNLNPMAWAEESHQLAVTKAHLLKEGQKPDNNYQHMVRDISEQRLALAGCRLAAILNEIAKK
ncbi:MAG: S1/P1 nuclease [Tatlockia sp.]|nr:S1/P1 nuclease [Tatlockia sp.]